MNENKPKETMKSEKQRIKERIEAETKRLDVLEKKCERCRKSIAALEGTLRERRFSEAESVINATGISLEDLVNALKQGDLTALQIKLESDIKKSE